MILLFSGGIDSYVAYHYLNKPSTLYCNLHTRYTEKELKTVKKLIPSTIIDSSLDLRSREPESAIIPYRNLYLALLANHYSDTIVIVGLKDDVAEDKNPTAFKNISALMTSLSKRPIRVMSPFWHLTKAEIVEWFLKNGGTKEQLLDTVSCYSSQDKIFCGKCTACFRKWCALRANNIYDLEFTNDALMKDYYHRALEGCHYDRSRNQNIINQVLSVHPEWK